MQEMLKKLCENVFFFSIRKTEEHEMMDFSGKPDETSTAQQNLNSSSSSKKWKIMFGTLLAIFFVTLIVILTKKNSTSGK